MTEPPLLRVDSHALRSFATVAEEYCRVIEHRHTLRGEQLLSTIHSILPNLYAAALELPTTDILFPDDDAEDDLPDPIPADASLLQERHQEWQVLYTSIAAMVGARNHYREVFDPYESATESPVTGSLADDFADIYRDLRDGLVNWRAGRTGDALWDWRFGFESHWGAHATGALRALHALSSTYDLPWPMTGPEAT